ncbi:MAG TPA: hypothetical protein VN706_16840 [Gemmatimonadaceae bacterium]|nr:hypothetical protein [Gemmatimonadaceae bacterium]
MYSLVRRYIKTAIMFLFVGLAIGGWMMTERELGPSLARTRRILLHDVVADSCGRQRRA